MATIVRDLSVSNIMQINATVIAGVLVLMAIGSFNQPNPSLVNGVLKTTNQWIALSLIPLCLSVLFAIGYNLSEDCNRKTRAICYYPMMFAMVTGFAYLMFVVYILATTLA